MSMLTRTVFVLSINLCVVACSAGGLLANDDDSEKSGTHSSIQDIADELVQDYPLPGVVLAIADVNRPLQIAASGLRKHDDSTRLLVDDKIHLGSCTKAMTATLVARLVEKNLLQFNWTIGQVLPSLTSDIHPQYHNVTIEQLLTHQSGMSANPANWWVHRGEPVSDIRLKIARTALGNEPEFIPGTKTLYSNLGYMIAGLMIEKVGGTTWEELITAEVFEPLGLSSAGFGPPSVNEKINQPWGHTLTSNGKLTAGQIDNAQALGPAGRVHMNFSDWAKFILAHASDGASLDDTNYLSAESWRKLHTPLLDGYSPGWIVTSRGWAKGNTYTHFGSNTWWSAVVWVAPNQKRAYLAGANVAGEKVANYIDVGVGKLIQFNQSVIE